eukprot:1161956-Pelagomonas_calceolata.AAC.22
MVTKHVAHAPGDTVWGACLDDPAHLPANPTSKQENKRSSTNKQLQGFAALAQAGVHQPRIRCRSAGSQKDEIPNTRDTDHP